MSSAALKRLTQDLAELHDDPVVGANAQPDEADLLTWYGLVVAPAGSVYAGIPIRFVLEFTSNYPNEPPKGFFETDVKYSGGAAYMVGNRLSICLDLFGNFAHVHTEWKTQSSGWSPSYSVRTILINLLSVCLYH
jgi:ubiquitin-protein ligase